MIKSKRKIEAVVSNARNFILIQKEFGSFNSYVWSFTEGQTIIYQHHLEGECL